MAKEDVVAILNGPAAGTTYEVLQVAEGRPVLGRCVHPGPAHLNAQRYLGLHGELFVKLPLPLPPRWLPKVSFRDAFVLDELAVWFCDRGLISGNFVWRDQDFDEVINVVWRKRIPITIDEVTSMFAAHGVGAAHHARLRDRFEAGMRLLCHSHGRPPIKKKRLKSFDNWESDPSAWLQWFGCRL